MTEQMPPCVQKQAKHTHWLVCADFNIDDFQEREQKWCRFLACNEQVLENSLDYRRQDQGSCSAVLGTTSMHHTRISFPHRGLIPEP
jgi:hypothetical protein